MTSAPASASFLKWEVIFSRASKGIELAGMGISSAALSSK